jgi:hypothetical protein
VFARFFAASSSSCFRRQQDAISTPNQKNSRGTKRRAAPKAWLLLFFGMWNLQLVRARKGSFQAAEAIANIETLGFRHRSGAIGALSVIG